MNTVSMSNSACATCPVAQNAQLIRLGLEVEGWDFVVALAGNPNTGKSTVFNALTGLRQHTGNWPGKTVARAEGGFLYEDRRFKLVDLPGTYSLLSASVDEEIARDFILFGQPNVTVIVVDATRLERNLNLVLQILEITDKAVVCLNLMDEAERHGLAVDARALSRDLGVPVIPAVARKGEGIPELLQAIRDVAVGQYDTRPHRIHNRDRKAAAAVEQLAAQIEETFPGLPNARWVAMRLLEGDERIIEAVQRHELGDLTQSVETRSFQQRLAAEAA
ncbi:MAG: 50S ribosome-binding GTPase [Anaerolineae bacterium]|nr:50S ribosome-binding GTPase [Anaerolineae bacterium]